jgi:hypothetical protein
MNELFQTESGQLLWKFQIFVIIIVIVNDILMSFKNHYQT